MAENPVCIYCRKDASKAKGLEHVIPESLGYKRTLPKGCICDKCNNYFSDIDHIILKNRYIALSVGTGQIPGKKGKIRERIGEKLSFPEKGHFSLESDPITLDKGTLKESYDFKFSQDKTFDEFKFARGIFKCAFNYYVFKNDQRAALNYKFNNLRKYIRSADKNEFWKYAVKLYSNEFFIKGEIVGFNILELGFLVSLIKDEEKIKSIARNNGYTMVNYSNQWNESSFLGLKI